jgi:SAM-dependent methyltransferase
MAQYSNDFIDRLHLIWGPGFLSPGGPEEVAEIVHGLDLHNALVLDIGCGTGGPAIVLARDMGARLICVDVEPQLLDRARKLATEAGVEDHIDFKLVEPGPLPFEADSFDAVFSKDALIHIPDKRSLYQEILRVLKPGGVFAASDWLSGENASKDEAFQNFLNLAHLYFTMATAPETAGIMREAGFDRVETRDRNAWYAVLSAQEVEEIEGALRDRIIEVCDPEIYKNWLTVRRALAAAAKSGGLRPTHLRGYRPMSIG